MSLHAGDRLPAATFRTLTPEGVKTLTTAEVFAGRKVLVFAEVVWFEGLGDFILFAEPFAEIDEFATFGTERPVLILKPGAGLLAGRATDYQVRIHNSLQLFTSRREKI